MAYSTAAHSNFGRCAVERRSPKKKAGRLHVKAGAMAEAAAEYGVADHGQDATRFIRFLEMTLGPDHEETAVQLTALAMAYQEGENYDEAADLFERVLGIHIKRHGPEHPLTMQAQFNLKSIRREIELLSSDDSDSDGESDSDSDEDSIEDEEEDEDSIEDEQEDETDGDHLFKPDAASTYAERAQLMTAQRRRESRSRANNANAKSGNAGAVQGVLSSDPITEVFDPNTNTTYFQSELSGATAWTREELEGASSPAQAPSAPAVPIEPLGSGNSTEPTSDAGQEKHMTPLQKYKQQKARSISFTDRAEKQGLTAISKSNLTSTALSGITSVAVDEDLEKLMSGVSVDPELDALMARPGSV